MAQSLHLAVRCQSVAIRAPFVSRSPARNTRRGCFRPRTSADEGTADGLVQLRNTRLAASCQRRRRRCLECSHEPCDLRPRLRDLGSRPRVAASRRTVSAHRRLRASQMARRRNAAGRTRAATGSRGTRGGPVVDRERHGAHASPADAPRRPLVEPEVAAVFRRRAPRGRRSHTPVARCVRHPARRATTFRYCSTVIAPWSMYSSSMTTVGTAAMPRARASR